MRLLFALLLVMMLTTATSADIALPQDGFYHDWKRADDTRRFVGNDLYGHINGGAELFHEFGFEDLLVQRYKKGEEEIILEVYRMESPEAALGIYLMKCGDETPIQEIESRNSGDRYQFNIVKGPCFIQVNNFSGSKIVLPAMTALAQQTLSALPDDDPAPLLGFLKKENLIEGSELIVRGPYSLQRIFTLGEGDILELGGKIYGVAGDFADDSGRVFTRVFILYPYDSAAVSAYENLLENLDPLLTILDKWNNGFSFKDYRNMFGSVIVNDRTMEISVGLSTPPKHESNEAR